MVPRQGGRDRGPRHFYQTVPVFRTHSFGGDGIVEDHLDDAGTDLIGPRRLNYAAVDE